MDAGRRDLLLAQPTRHQLFCLLAELRRPAGTEELAERLGRHPNGVRVHLERLRAGGLVERTRSPQPRGRPRDMWTIDPRARGSLEPYVDLGRLLARAISPGGDNLRAAEATGREIGRTIAQEAPGGTPEETIHDALATMGFAPKRRVDHRSGTLTYELCNCPYRDAVRENQPVVCTLHRGITRGLLDALAPDTRLTRFVANDPVTAGCLIELRGGLADQAAMSPPAGPSR